VNNLSSFACPASEQGEKTISEKSSAHTTKSAYAFTPHTDRRPS
jgi:hypothetical protein